MTAEPRVRSVNVAHPRRIEGVGRTAIDKRPVDGPVAVRRPGPAEAALAGDAIAKKKFHGGPDQAVYAFAREDLDHWERALGQPIPDGRFGENLTTEGIDVNEAEVGERWRIGSTLLEVASIRIPCAMFRSWQRLGGYDAEHWQKRFTAEGRPGPYLRVVEDGVLRAGDRIEVVHRPGHGVTVSTMFRALTTDRTLLPSLLAVEDLIDEARDLAAKYLAASG